MNPVFVFLILIGAFILWVLCSFVFYPFGCFIVNWAKKVNKNMNKDEKPENDNKQKEED